MLQNMVAPPKGRIPLKLKKAPNAFLNATTAKEWLDQHKKLKDKWEVEDEDLYQDGRHEVVVRDKKTHAPVIINGWTLARDDYPYRQQYYSLDSTQREGKSYGHWARDRYIASTCDPKTPWLYNYGPASDAALAEMQLYRDQNYIAPISLKKRDSGFNVFLEAFDSSLSELYNLMLSTTFGDIKISQGGVSQKTFQTLYTQNRVRIRVMERLFPKNLILKNLYNMILGAFVVFQKNKYNLVGIVQEIHQNHGLDYKKLYRSLSLGVEPVFLLSQLKIIQLGSDGKWSAHPDHQNFVTEVIKPLLFENIELQLSLFRGKVDYNKLTNGNKTEKKAEKFNLYRQLDIVLFGGEAVVEGVNAILSEHDLDGDILNNTVRGRSALTELKKQIADDWKARIKNWNVMLPLLVNASTALAMLNILDVPHKDAIVPQLEEMKNNAIQQLLNS